tara:strand:- start:316 stop:648 length:333 start_codon:yes stop_codon:yes gene_type:complete
MTKKGEIWLINLPGSDGREQFGRRPGLILADTKTALVIVAPVSKNLEAVNKFLYTLRINRSNLNGLDYDSVLALFQLKCLDKKRLIHKLGTLEDYYLDQINKNLRNLLQL